MYMTIIDRIELWETCERVNEQLTKRGLRPTFRRMVDVTNQVMLDMDYQLSDDISVQEYYEIIDSLSIPTTTYDEYKDKVDDNQ